MLAAASTAAASHAERDAMAPIEWVEADVVTWEPEADRFDAVISRFGVMFFSDPVAAFGHLARAARPGGRLAVATWQRRDSSPLFAVPLYASLEVVLAQRIGAATGDVDIDGVVPADDQGPFSLHDPAAIRALLEQAGWSKVNVDQHLLPMPFAGGAPPDVAATAALDFGPTRLLLQDADDDLIDAAVKAIADAFSEHVDSHGHVVLAGAINVVTGTA
jgi:SAM-dependent methyltransferase